MTRPKNLRDSMPLVTAFYDDLRAAFGADDINQSMKDGIAGLPRFWASENGLTVGTKAPEGMGVTAAQMVLGSAADVLKGKK